MTGSGLLCQFNRFVDWSSSPGRCVPSFKLFVMEWLRKVAAVAYYKHLENEVRLSRLVRISGGW